MSEVITNSLWLQAFQKKQLDSFLQRGLPTRKEENWKYTPIAEAVNGYCQPSLLKQLLEVGRLNQAIESEKVSESNKEVSNSLGQFLSTHLQLPATKLSSENQEMIQLVFVNGVFCKEVSRIQGLPSAVICLPLSEAVVTHEKIVKNYLTKAFDVQQFPFATLNSALVIDGLFLYIPKNVRLSTPIHIIHMNKQNQIHLRNLIIAEESSQINIVEEYVSYPQAENAKYFSNGVTDVIAKQNAIIGFYKIQNESMSAIHTNQIFISQNQDSQVRLFTLSKGALLSREDVVVTQSERGAECHLSGLYALSSDDQHADHHISVDHMAEHGTSSMLYKGILDKKSRAVFNGRVHVHAHAQHIDAYQANHNILLSKEAEINTKPELEIYADNVKCAHGATVGQLDTDALFYFRSRGIGKEDAFKLLLNAFAEEVLNLIQPTEIRQYIQAKAGSYVEL